MVTFSNCNHCNFFVVLISSFCTLTLSMTCHLESVFTISTFCVQGIAYHDWLLLRTARVWKKKGDKCRKEYFNGICKNINLSPVKNLSTFFVSCCTYISSIAQRLLLIHMQYNMGRYSVSWLSLLCLNWIIKNETDVSISGRGKYKRKCYQSIPYIASIWSYIDCAEKCTFWWRSLHWSFSWCNKKNGCKTCMGFFFVKKKKKTQKPRIRKITKQRKNFKTFFFKFKKDLIKISKL